MRSETEMMNTILERAQNDPHIRAVMLSGSRVNPEVKPDCFQDYDVIYLVDDLHLYLQNPDWTACFGEKMIEQLPEQRKDGSPRQEGKFVYLMQFQDGNRIDLTLITCKLAERTQWESLTKVLLDKDGRFPSFPEPSDSDYVVRPPDAHSFGECCNEFWWVSTYIAKGLWRSEITYAKSMMDDYVRDMLMKMLGWYVGMRTGFTKSVGKKGKFLERYLDKPMWLTLLKTYPDAEREHIWEALFVMCGLFRTVAQEIALAFGYDYPQGDDERVSDYLRQVHSLPCDSQEIYPDPPQEEEEISTERISSSILLQFTSE